MTNSSHVLGFLALTAPAFIPSGPAPAAEEVWIPGPNERVQLGILPRPGRLAFTVKLGDTVVIEPSPLGMLLDGVDLSSGVEVGPVERYLVDEAFPWHGAHARAVNACRGARISLTHVLSGAQYTLEVRVFDQGAAFRHVIPGDERPRVPDEGTTFVIPAGSTVWCHDLGGHYEAPYEERDVSGLAGGEWAGPPVTIELPGGAGYAAITEADLVGYSGMALQADGRRGFTIGLGHRQPLNHPFELRYGKEEGRRLSRPASIPGSITTPWRVVMAARDLDALVNSDILPALCPPPDPTLFPQGAGTDWIKPGRAVWRYLDGGERTLDGMKDFARLAGELGFEHHVIEGFWSRWSDEQIKDLVESSRRHGVGTWLWKHTRELRAPEARREFFGRCRELGVCGVKLDFFDHEAKEVIDLYEALLREAAASRLLVNFHGSNKPTGRARTWPNELTREGVRGMESSRLKERARHDVILPFTRFLAGHADYTPVHFGDRRADTTAAHQIASAAIFAGPLLTHAAHPRKLLDHPAAGVIKRIPAVWDETVVLPISRIGQVAAFARRRGSAWFLAVMNGPAARKVEVPLAFLGEGELRATLVRDVEADPTAVRVEEATLRRESSISIEMSPGGGFIARFAKE